MSDHIGLLSPRNTAATVVNNGCYIEVIVVDCILIQLGLASWSTQPWAGTELHGKKAGWRGGPSWLAYRKTSSPVLRSLARDRLIKASNGMQRGCCGRRQWVRGGVSTEAGSRLSFRNASQGKLRIAGGEHEHRWPPQSWTCARLFRG